MFRDRPARDFGQRRQAELRHFAMLQMRGTLDQLFRLLIEPEAEPFTRAAGASRYFAALRAMARAPSLICQFDAQCTSNRRRIRPVSAAISAR